MPRYRITTLIDITLTDAKKNDVDQKKILQQSNFNSLRQAIELRSNVSWDQAPERHHGRLPSAPDGKSVYWIWDFDVEREDLFLDRDDPTALLKDDLNGVPIIAGLEDLAEIDPPAIQTRGKNVNTWVEMLRI